HVADKSISLANRYFKDIPKFATEHWSGYLNGGFEKLSLYKRAKRIRQINTCESLVVVSESLKKALIDFGVKIPVKVIPNVIEHGILKQHFNTNPQFLVVADLVDEIKNISGIIVSFKNQNIPNT